MKVIEKVAKAIVLSRYGWEAPVNVHHLKEAEAAIGAMREPNEEMIDKGFDEKRDAFICSDEKVESIVYSIYTAMIDRANNIPRKEE